MEFDDCIYRLYELSRTENEELQQRFHSLASDVSKNGITGLVPIEEGGITGMATLFLTKIIRCCECCGVMAPIALDNEHPRI